MKTLWIALCCVTLGWVASFPSMAADQQPPAEGGPFPAFTMPAPRDADHQAYLGLAEKKEFAVADIAAEVVIIEIFNMY